MFLNFLWYFILSIAAQLLAPTPKLPQAPSEKPKYPGASEDAPLAWGEGTFLVAGNQIWDGDDRRVEQTRKVKVNWFKSVRQTYGWKYYHGFWFSLTACPVHELLAIRVGERTVWSGRQVLSRTEPTEVAVNATWTRAEGQEVPDGLIGKFIFYNQAIAEGDTDTAPLPMPYLASMLGGERNVPGYPNRCHAVFVGPSGGDGMGFVGSSRQLEGITFVFRKYSDLSAAFPPGRAIKLTGDSGFTGDAGSDDGRAWLEGFLLEYGDIAGDNNPALTLLELLTTRVPGIGPKLTPWAVEAESFLAAARVLRDEDNGASFTWDATQERDELLSALLLQINGTLEMNERTGQVALKLMRAKTFLNGYASTVKAVFNDSNIIELQQFTRIQPDGAPNEVQVSFIDRAGGWKSRPAKAQNAAAIRAAGRLITEQKSYLAVSRYELASQLASRDVRMMSSPLASVRFTAFAPGSTPLVLKPGDLIRVALSDYSPDIYMRVTSSRFADFSADRRLRLEIEALEEIYYAGTASPDDGSPPPVIDVSVPPASVVNPAVFAAPYALTGSDADVLMYVADDPGLSTTSYRLALQPGASWVVGAEADYVNETVEPCLSAPLRAPLGAGIGDTTLSLTMSESAIEQWKRQGRGALFVIIGSEWLRCASWTLAGDVLMGSGLERGVLDTVPQAHAAGTSARVVLGFALDTDPASGPVAVRAESAGPAGRLDPDEAAASGAVWAGPASPARAARPLLPGLVKIDGVLGALNELETAPPALRADELTLTWVNRNRLTKQPNGYFSPSEGTEPGAVVSAKLEWRKDDGTWEAAPYGVIAGGTGTGWQAAPAGANALTFDLTNAPDGARPLRVTVRVERGGVQSPGLVLRWQLQA